MRERGKCHTSQNFHVSIAWSDPYTGYQLSLHWSITHTSWGNTLFSTFLWKSFYLLLFQIRWRKWSNYEICCCLCWEMLLILGSYLLLICINHHTFTSKEYANFRVDSIYASWRNFRQTAKVANSFLSDYWRRFSRHKIMMFPIIFYLREKQ